MKPVNPFPLSLLAFFGMTLSPAAEESSPAQEETQENVLKQKVEKVMVEQDELQADVQELVAEQTDEEVVSLLEECQGAMNEAIDGLEAYNTGGSTIAAQTEVIELIFKAADKKAGSSGNAGGMQGLLQMMRGMMGEDYAAEGQGDGEGEGKEGKGKGDGDGDEKGDAEGEGKGKGGNTPGKGGNGGGSVKNDLNDGAMSEKKEPRRLPKSAGKAGVAYPREFSQAMDAYNKSLEPGSGNRTSSTN